jgi:hypothetical protein
MLLFAGFNRVGNQLGHLLATADQGDALVQHKTDEISTVLADKKFVHNLDLLLLSSDAFKLILADTTEWAGIILWELLKRNLSVINIPTYRTDILFHWVLLGSLQWNKLNLE